MKSFTIATVLAIALPAIAQTVADLPQCAQQPILLAISASGCGLTDIPCICANNGFVSGLLQTIPTLCTPAETAIVSGFAVRLCGAAGVTLSLPSDVVSATSLSAPSSRIQTTSSEAVTTSSAAQTTATPASTGSATLLTTSSLATTARSNATITSPTVSSSAAATTSARANEGALQGVGFAGLVGALALGFVGL